MAVKVVDASAVAAVLFGEPEADEVAERLRDARLVAPGLLAFELANVCLVKMRRHPHERLGLSAAFRLRARLGVEEIAVDHEQAVELATANGLTAYDASYLWLARELGAELVTLDRRLAKAALSDFR
jgi:predicted nucleic acid-binding protein